MQIFYDLLKHVKTTGERDRLILEIDILLDSLFSTKKNAFQKALESISIKNAEAIKEAILKKKLGKQDIKEALIELKEKAQKLNTVNITLAFSPSEEAVNDIFAWVVKNIGEGFILDIQVDEAILGGIVLTLKGKYIDLSLKKGFAEIFAKKRKEITKLPKLL